MSLGRYKTAGEVINGAALELGLIAAPLVDPYANVDPNVVQLRQYLRTAGQDLSQHYEWGHLQVEAVLTKSGGVWTLPTGWTDLGGDKLAMSADFLSLVPRSGWDRSNRLPLGGPLNAQYWQFRKAGTTVVIWAEVRTDALTLRFLPTPLPDRTIALEYQSAAWVRPAASGAGNFQCLAAAGWDAPEASGDFCILDRSLLVAYTRLTWRERHGFDVASAWDDFDRDVAEAVDNQRQARVLNLSGVRRGPRLIDLRSVPDSGYGV